MTFFINLLFAISARAELNSNEVDQFFHWLSQTEKQFSECKIESKNGFYNLCDNTKVSKNVLVQLAAQNSAKIEKFFLEKNIRTIKLCDSSAAGCSKPDSKTQKQMSQLHGLYNPIDNSITFKEGSSAGVLIHEFVHYLQTRNENPINGKVYKKNRLEIQKKISAELDILEARIAAAQKNKDQKNLMDYMQKFININNYMLQFGHWQDLVDERSIFLLYKQYGKEIGISKADIDFAIKKLENLCENPKLKSLLKNECP